MKKTLFLIFLSVSILCSGANASDGKLKNLHAQLDSPNRFQRVNAAKIISSSGYQAEGLYEKVAKIIEDNYLKNYDSDLTDEISWMCKALAASGDPSYKPLLQKVASEAPNNKLVHYAKQSLDRFETYQERNDVLNKEKDWDESLSADENKIVNLLRSSDVSFKRDAAKMITRKPIVDEKVYAEASAALMGIKKSGVEKKLHVDTMAWLCKALAASGDKRYAEVIKYVIENTSNYKLVEYAKKALKALE